MHRQHNTPLRVSVVAVFVALLMAFLFGGTTRADEESLQSAATQSANVATEAQSSDTVTTAATSDNEDQSSSGVATGSNCTPRPISAEEVADQYVETVDGTAEFTAYEAVEFGFTLHLQESHCAGDSITFSVPSELGTDGSFEPIEMRAKDGTVVAKARYSSDRTVEVTLTSAVEDTSKHNFQASAWWKVHMEDVLVPGEIRELEWNIGGIVRRTPITVGTCPNCNKLGEGPSKWGVVSSLKPWYMTVTVITPTAQEDGQEFVFTDKSTSPGQDFACPDPTVGQAGVYSSAGPWGQPMYTRFIDVTIESCDSEKAVFKLVLNKGEKARVNILINIDPADKGPWTDEVTFNSKGKTWVTVTKVTRKESGGGAGFDPVPTPTPTPTPSPSPSAPSPTPSPSPTPTPVTPTPAPSASPSPSPTPSTSPEPTPSTTPEPSPSATPSTSPAPTPEPTPSATPTPSVTPTPSTTPEPAPTPSTTPSATSSATPSTAPSPMPTPSETHQRKLAVTGTDGSAIAGAVALLTAGVATFWMRRRQTTHPEG